MKQEKTWRQPEFLLPATVALFVCVVYPLYQGLRNVYEVNIGGHLSHQWWIFTTLYFGCFAWGECILLGCRLVDILVPVVALSFGVLMATAFALREPGVASALMSIGFGYGFYCLLLTALFLLTVVEVMLLKREEAKHGSE